MLRDTGPFSGSRIKPKGWLSLALGGTQLLSGGLQAYNAISGGGGAGTTSGGIQDIVSALPQLLQFAAPYLNQQQMQNITDRIAQAQLSALGQVQGLAGQSQQQQTAALQGGLGSSEAALMQTGQMGAQQLQDAVNQAIQSRMAGGVGAGNQLVNYLNAAVPAIQQGYGMGIGALAPYAGAGQNALAALMQGMGLGTGGAGAMGGMPWAGTNMQGMGIPGQSWQSTGQQTPNMAGGGGLQATGGYIPPQGQPSSGGGAVPGMAYSGPGPMNPQFQSILSASPGLFALMNAQNALGASGADMFQPGSTLNFPNPAAGIRSLIGGQDVSPQSIIAQLQAAGATPQMVDQAMGWSPGTAAGYQQQFGGGGAPAGGVPATPNYGAQAENWLQQAVGAAPGTAKSVLGQLGPGSVANWLSQAGVTPQTGASWLNAHGVTPGAVSQWLASQGISQQQAQDWLGQQGITPQMAAPWLSGGGGAPKPAAPAPAASSAPWWMTSAYPT